MQLGRSPMPRPPIHEERMNTVLHVRVPDEIYSKAQEQAKRDHTSVAEVVRRCLEAYVSGKSAEFVIEYRR